MNVLEYWYEIVFLLGLFGMIVINILLLISVSLMLFRKEDVEEITKKTDKKKEKTWMILSESIIGNDHLKKDPPIPCQDNHAIEKLNDLWGIAVVSDGLGSKSLSHIGSEFVVKKTVSYLKEVVDEKEWITLNQLPSQEEWNIIAYDALYRVHKDLEGYAQIYDYKLSELACTVIAVIYSPYGLLITHIGDGRAGYKTLQGEWKSMMNPINGQSSSEVMPITAPFWKETKMVGTFLESRVINTPVEAFTLMSDGCESFSYETLKWNEKTSRYDEINLPFSGFFDPVIKYFTEKQKEVSIEVLNEEWKEFLTNGNAKIINEADDKTLVLGFIQNEVRTDENQNN